MTRRLVSFVALAVVLGALFIRLGFWQLERRAERRAANDRILRQLERPPAPITELVGRPDAANRRAVVEGRQDFANEIIVTGRSRSGSPGVYLLTPVRLAGHDTAVLVNRGWVYSADAATVDAARWRESRDAFSGYTHVLPATAPAVATTTATRARTIRQLSWPAVARLLPYPVHRVYLVARDSAATDSAPARLDQPVLGDGPHLSYAIQWFSFAAIALVGAAIVVTRARDSTGA